MHESVVVRNARWIDIVKRSNERTKCVFFVFSLMFLSFQRGKCDCPCENLYKRSTNVFAFEQLKTKEKTPVCSKRMNPAFACIRVHTLDLVRSPAFTAEGTAFFSTAVVCSFRTQKCVRNKRSE